MIGKPASRYSLRVPTAPTLPAVILVRPSHEGNIGATARAMANMGLERLILVEPAARTGATARAFAVGAQKLLKAARRVESLAAALAPFQRVVGTTSARGRELGRPVLKPRQLARRVQEDPPGTGVALVFGPERSGLTEDELALCGLLVRIPCAPEQPTLNLAQAVLIVAYELHHARRIAAPRVRRQPDRAPARTEQIEGLFAQAEELLADAGFARDTTFAAVRRDLRALAARSGLTAREVTILRGICRRLGHAVASKSR